MSLLHTVLLIILSYNSSFLFSLIWSGVLFTSLIAICWDGSFLLFEGTTTWSLAYLAFIVYVFVMLSERFYFLRKCTQLLCLISFIFFSSSSFLFIWIILEATLLPLLLMLLCYGSQAENVVSSYYLIFYSVSSGMLFLIPYFSFLAFNFSPALGTYTPPLLLYFLSIPFFINVPLFFFHLWLPKVHVEASASTSVLLASLLLKIGCFALSRLVGSYVWAGLPLLMLPILLSIIFLPLVACFLSDGKALAAYSSIVHMGFFLLTFFTFSYAKSASAFILLSHGLVSPLFFYFLGLLYDSYSSRLVYFTCGLWASSLFHYLFFIGLILADVSVPPFLGFYGEVLALGALYLISPWLVLFLIIYFMYTYYYTIFFIVCVSNGEAGIALGTFFYTASLPFYLLILLFLLL